MTETLWAWLRRYPRELSVAAVWTGLMLVLAIFRPDFYTHQLVNTAVDAAPLLVAAVGMTLVILTRQIDISIGSQLAVCGVVAGMLAQQRCSMPVVALGAVATGAALGAINGLLIAGLRMPSIVVTLATLVIWRESLRWLREGNFVRDLPDYFQWFGLSQSGGRWVIVGCSLLLFLLAAVLLRWLAVARTVLAVGSDEEAARLAGIRPQRVVCWVFVALGALVGLAALLTVVQLPQVDPRVGTGLEMKTIAAVVVGGTAISGGRGTLVGTLLGVGLLATVSPALPFLHIPSHWDQAVQGAIILLAVAAEGKEKESD